MNAYIRQYCVFIGAVCIGPVALFSRALTARVAWEEPLRLTYAINLCEGRLDDVDGGDVDVNIGVKVRRLLLRKMYWRTRHMCDSH